MNIYSPAYQKAFIQYLRRGTAIELTLKMEAEKHPTTHYIWHTREDEKVRPSHAANDGKIFAWDDPPPTGNSEDEFGCRCWAEPYYPPAANPDFLDNERIDPAYPEILIISFIQIRWLADLWHAWSLEREIEKIRFGKFKSPKKWANQIEDGGWTPEKIIRTRNYGTQSRTINKTNGNTPATRYTLGNDFVVIDDITGEIIQISRPRPGGFKPNEF